MLQYLHMETKSDSHVPQAASLQLSTSVPCRWKMPPIHHLRDPSTAVPFAAGHGWEIKSLHSIQGPNCPCALSAERAMMEKPARGEDKTSSVPRDHHRHPVSPCPVTSKHQAPALPDSMAQPALDWCRGRGREHSKQVDSPAFPALLA